MMLMNLVRREPTEVLGVFPFCSSFKLWVYFMETLFLDGKRYGIEVTGIVPLGLKSLKLLIRIAKVE